MKKLLSIALLLMTTCLCVQAYDWTDENGTIWSFDINGSNATLYKGANINSPCISGIIPSELTIPAVVYVGESAYSVTSIGAYAFSYCSSYTINIPESVTSIGTYAFYSCSSLTSINIPESVTFIGNSAFILCSNLTNINIPERVTSIGAYTFRNCI